MMHLLFTLLLMAACTSPSTPREKKQIAHLNLHTEPPTLDPRKASDSTSVSVIKMCFDGLMRMGREGKPEHALAKEIKISPKGDRYTFRLRKAFWSDGAPLTASDFEESWKTALDPRFPSERAYDLYILKNAKRAKEGAVSLSEVGVKALDDHTLQIELEYPTAHFLQILTSHPFLPTPRHVEAERYVGSGPFKLKKWRHYNEIILEKNPYYWDADAVKLDKVHLSIMGDENTELVLFEKGDLDWVGDPLSLLPIDSLPTLFKKCDIKEFPFSGVYFFVFNTKQYPFHNVKLRRALALAIDRQAIIDHVVQGNQTPAMSFIPPTMWEKTEPYFKDADHKKAQALFSEALQELGLTRETFPSVIFSYNTVSSHHKIAQAVQQQWKEVLGIDLRLENKEWQVFLSELLHHQFQIARMGGVASVNDPADFLETYRYDTSDRNFSQWHNEKFSDYLAKAERCKNAEKRMGYLKKAEEILMNEMPVIPLYFYMGHYLHKPHLKNVHISEINEIDLKHAYIESATN